MGPVYCVVKAEKSMAGKSKLELLKIRLLVFPEVLSEKGLLTSDLRCLVSSNFLRTIG